jgi:hypothetical protein
VLNDLVGNIHNARGPGGLILKAAGFAGDRPQIPRVVSLKIIEDKLPLRRQLEAWADIATLTRIIVSHGDPIVTQPPGDSSSNWPGRWTDALPTPSASRPRISRISSLSRRRHRGRPA